MNNQKLSTACILFSWAIFGLAPLDAQPAASFRELDRHARQAPTEQTRDLPSLTAFLTARAGGELEKARVLYSWVVQSISYEESGKRGEGKRVNQSVGDILRRRRGLCFDYALLYAALCREAGLSCEVISGYSRTRAGQVPDLEEVDHAWNTVLVEGEWRLVDPTWGSTDKSRQVEEEDPYFLARPEQFVRSHLPQAPMWQLLEHPLSPEEFQRGTNAAAGRPHFAFRDSIDQWRILEPAARRLREQEMAWRYHPVPANRHALGHAWMDQAGILSDRLDSLALPEQGESYLHLGEELITACRQGFRFADTLYPWQYDLYLGGLVNQAVALYQLADKQKDPQAAYRQAIELLTEAGAAAAALSAPSSYALRIRRQSEEYIAVIREQLRE